MGRGDWKRKRGHGFERNMTRWHAWHDYGTGWRFGGMSLLIDANIEVFFLLRVYAILALCVMMETGFFTAAQQRKNCGLGRIEWKWVILAKRELQETV